MTLQTKPSHRHFVVAPLFVAALLFSMRQGIESPVVEAASSGFSAQVVSDGSLLQFPNGVEALIYSGRGLTKRDDELYFAGGTALIYARGAATLQLGNRTVTMLDGLFHLSSHGDSVTIAALTSPVVVQHGSRLAVVPVGHQWRVDKDNVLPAIAAGFTLWQESRALQPLPQHFVKRQLMAAKRFVKKAPELPTVVTYEPRPMPWNALRLGEARKQAETSLHQARLGALRFAIEQNNVEQLRAYLQNSDWRETVLSEDLETLFGNLLSQTPRSSAVALELLTYLQDNDALWLALSLHPTYRDSLWVQFDARPSNDLALLRLFGLAASDTAYEPVSILTMQYWKNEAERLPKALLAELSPEVLSQVHRHLSAHRPLRAERWSSVLLTLLEELETLPEELAGTEEELRLLHAVSSEPVVLPQPTEAPVAATKETVAAAKRTEVQASYSPTVVEQRAYAVLREMGALFTVQTTVEATAPDTATVKDIIFGTPDGDKTFTFQFNVATGTIASVQVESREYPYALSVSAFRKWIHG